MTTNVKIKVTLLVLLVKKYTINQNEAFDIKNGKIHIFFLSFIFHFASLFVKID